MIHVQSVAAAFSAAECDHLALIVAEAPAQAARLVGQRESNMRRADLVWIDEVAGAEWVMDRLIEITARANREAFGFDLTDFSESPQVARYDAAREGHFDWHSDIGDGRLAARRKLTLVVQLSEPEEYEGGALEIMPSGHVVAAERGRGAATLFPSYLLHRVTPVTAGVRQSLTVWAHGPAFR
ncbi:2OG-Fe(II) oxygenase [Pseudoroseicyclus tamaricis]|uniref:2OG-Fe(II) oxygenase n=1 Tax=Pseudoroseicyclus tamaricis TaxID=2705421 RepID=A0A6B2JVI4_9RHOB|nr:2OG-Fe(II) oxygenase [Pseudoroseicyclus tamaricis]NDV02507.1 2OG-Fe(II) oxygenase [Pseudoroseicyclus tamaricis]